MTELSVDIDKMCVASYYSPERYGDWSESWNNSFKGVRVYNERLGGEKITTPFNVKKHTIVYVLWAEYTTGNSFGRANNGSVEVIDVFLTEEKAEEAMRILEEGSYNLGYGKDRTPSVTVYKNENGDDIKIDRPWMGYFERLDSLHVSIANVK